MSFKNSNNNKKTEQNTEIFDENLPQGTQIERKK